MHRRGGGDLQRTGQTDTSAPRKPRTETTHQDLQPMKCYGRLFACQLWLRLINASSSI